MAVSLEPIRECRKCGLKAFTREDLEEFVKKHDAPYGRTTECISCKSMRMKLYDVKKRYNISLEEYEKCMETSNCCEICGATKKSLEGTNSRLCYDHDHHTMEFRGVLCTACNYAIGVLGDNKEGILKALSYFNKSK